MLFEEKEELTLKDKIFKWFAGIFMTILVVMLIFTLLPNDAEQSLYKLLTGQDTHSAGKFGSETITMDYFQAAKRDCYSRYKEAQANLDTGLLNSCAYNTIKELKVSRAIANSVGYDISENKIKELLFEQAKQIHKDSAVSAGYSQEEQLTEKDIYRNLLQSTSLDYRKDIMVLYGLYNFLKLNWEESENSKVISSEVENLKFNLEYVSFSEVDLLNKVEKEVQISEEELQTEYEKSKNEGKLAKNEKGEYPTLEERKPILYNQIKSEKKQKLVAELKSKIQSLKNSETKDILKQIAQLTNSQVEEIKNISLKDLSNPSNNSKFYRFASNRAFLKDLIELPFDKGNVGGPYMEEDKAAYVEFKTFSFESKEKKNLQEEDSLKKMQQYILFEEVKQAVAAKYPLYRKFDKQVE